MRVLTDLGGITIFGHREVKIQSIEMGIEGEFAELTYKWIKYIEISDKTLH